MARLTAAERKALPNSDFAGPNRTYPVEDKAHAVAAKGRATQFASPALEGKIDAKADKKLGKKRVAALAARAKKKPHGGIAQAMAGGK